MRGDIKTAGGARVRSRNGRIAPVVNVFQGRLEYDRIGAGLRQPAHGRGRVTGVMVGDVQVDDEAVAIDAPGGSLPLGDELARTSAATATSRSRSGA